MAHKQIELLKVPPLFHISSTSCSNGWKMSRKMPFRQLKVSFTASWLVNQRDKQLTYVTQRNGKNSSDSIFSAPGYCHSSLPSGALLHLKGSTGPVLNLSWDTPPRRNPEPSAFKGCSALCPEARQDLTCMCSVLFGLFLHMRDTWDKCCLTVRTRLQPLCLQNRRLFSGFMCESV